MSETGTEAIEAPKTAVLIAREIDNDRVIMSHGSYDYFRVLQLSGGAILPGGLTTSGGQISEFEFIPRVMNFGRTICEFDNLVAAAGANLYNIYHNDTVSEWREIELLTRSGLSLARIQDVNVYLKMTLRMYTKFDVMMDNDVIASVSGYWEGLHKNAQTIAVPSVTYTPGTADGNAVIGSSVVMTSYVPNMTQIPLVPALATVVVSNINVPSYYVVGAANDPTPQIRRKIPFSLFYGTILAEDRDQYFAGETTLFRVTWAPSTRVFYKTGSLTDLSNAAANGAPDANGLTNFQIYLAVEKNDVIAQAIKDKVNAGVTISIPYVWQVKQPLQNSPQIVNIKFNVGHGKRLMKLLWSVFTQSETNNNAYNNTNVNGSKVTSFYTSLNGTKTTQYDLVCANGDDYRLMSKRLKGSCITCSNDFYQCWVWEENFCNNYAVYEKPLNPPEQNYIDGLDLVQQEQNYQIYATTAVANFTHYIYAICQRDLRIQQGLIQYV